jgi:hypothetical protein
MTLSFSVVPELPSTRALAENSVLRRFRFRPVRGGATHGADEANFHAIRGRSTRELRAGGNSSGIEVFGKGNPVRVV